MDGFDAKINLIISAARQRNIYLKKKNQFHGYETIS